MPYDYTSDSSSDLSDPPSSPELPPSFQLYPTPEPSQSDDRDDTPSTHPQEDMPPVKKRRKIEAEERTTRRLDLDNLEDDDDKALEMMLKALRKREKIVVVVGAGISVSAGIPDFRSSNGLFRTLREEHKLKASGKQLFDASVYKSGPSTSSFHDMVRKLSNMSSQAKPTPFHRLLARLAKEERLLRLYTQNVDDLELTLPPLETQIPLNHKGPWPKTVQLHGGLTKMVCHKCKITSKFQPELFEGPEPPLCPQCEEQETVRTTHAGKRSHGIGKMRPRIVLYNEQNPDEDAIGAIVASDLRARPDAVIVAGTSLKIPPVRRIVREMCMVARGRKNGVTMMVNKESITLGKDLEDCFDLLIEGKSDSVAEMANLKEWDDDSKDVIEECTASDVEQAKAKQQKFNVLIETPKKKNKHTAISSNGMMTPPISRDESVVVDTKPTTIDSLKNPASLGRSIAEVLGQGNKENLKKKSKTTKAGFKSSGLKKVQTIKKPSSTQTKITGRVTKPGSNVSIQIPKLSTPKKTATKDMPGKPFLPVPPQEKRNNAPMFPGLTRRKSYDSDLSEYSTIPESPRSWDDSKLETGKREERETISPSGSVPKDMVKLLN